MKLWITGAAMLLALSTQAQDSSLQKQAGTFSVSGFAEAYYSYDLNKPANALRPAFLYSHNRHNEFNINLAFIKGSYTAENIRANVALAAGTYMNANYAAEPGVLKNIYEANVGVKISKHHDLWIDAGILPSHIGFESAQSSVCWTLTRSMMAENSPYYEAGARLTYTTANGRWLLSALALNGWQRIQRVAGNSLMSWGTQVQFKPSSKVLLNYSTFIGTDSPDSARVWRYFHDIYATFQFTDQWGLILACDVGQQQAEKGKSNMHTWFAPIAIVRYTPAENWAFAARTEYYNDGNGVIIASNTPNGFKTFGASLNIDRNIGTNCLWRTEIRMLKSKDAIFTKTGSLADNNTAITTSLALTF